MRSWRDIKASVNGRLFGTGIKVETRMVAGRYQHKVTTLGVYTEMSGVQAAMEKANEIALDVAPEGAGPIVNIVKYSVSGPLYDPRKSDQHKNYEKGGCN